MLNSLRWCRHPDSTGTSGEHIWYLTATITGRLEGMMILWEGMNHEEKTTYQVKAHLAEKAERERSGQAEFRTSPQNFKFWTQS